MNLQKIKLFIKELWNPRGDERPGLRAFIIRQKIRLDMGRNNLAITQWLMLFYITIKTALGDYANELIVVGLAGIGVFCLWCFGFFWDKSKLLEEEIEFQNTRNLFVKDVRGKGVKVVKDEN